MEASSPLVIVILRSSLFFNSFVAVDLLKNRFVWDRRRHYPPTSGSCLGWNAVCLDRDFASLAQPAASARFSYLDSASQRHLRWP